MSDYIEALLGRTRELVQELRGPSVSHSPLVVARALDELAGTVERLSVYRHFAPRYMLAKAEAKAEEPGHSWVPPVRVEQRELEPSAMDHTDFPASPRRAWKEALGLPGCRMTFAAGPWVNAAGTKVLQDVMPSLLLRAGTASAFLIMHWHQQGGAWKFVDAWLGPRAKQLNSREAMQWLKESQSTTTTR